MTDCERITLAIPVDLLAELDEWASGRLVSRQSAVRYAVDRLLHPWRSDALAPEV